MLSSIKIRIFGHSFFPLMLSVAMLLLLVSCVQSNERSGLNSAGSVSANGKSNTPATPAYQEPTFPLSGIFIQEGSNRTNSNFAIPVNFEDSFLVRGLTLSKFLRTIPNTTKFCMVGKYTHTPGSDRFFVMAAKPKSYTDLINKTTEFYLQVEPSNDQANQNDCLTYNLSSTLINSGTAPTLTFGLTQLCSNCTTSITSTPLKLFFNNGEEVPGILLGALAMTVSGSTSTTTNSCVESTSCKARGFDCCLQAQCVKDGAIKPDALLNSGFMSAQEDVRNNPDRFVVYPQFYFVCASRPEQQVGSGGASTTDPNYEAAIRILELKHLHDCLNQVDGEFSYCTVKFTEASKTIPGNFSALKDDMNFTSLNQHFGSNLEYKNNIVKVEYAGSILYEINKTTLSDASFVASTENDNLSSTQSINITATLPTNAQDDNLYLTYKVDGTCEKIGSSLARCTKTYIQSSTDTLSTYWHDSSRVYNLPSYADTSSTANIIVKISGLLVPEDAATWSRGSSPRRINFVGTYDIFQNQKVEITYFVSTNVDELMKSRTAAQTKVNTICTCSSSSKCNLKPLLNESKQVINYECTYPTAASGQPPINQVVYVSSKNVPHRYFDTNGVSYDEDYATALDQEGTAFKYNNNDTLNPNNKTQYIGFNEVYGSFGKTGTLVARPPKYARVKKDMLYDIVVSAGVYASCQNCGTDYWTGVQRVFPQNFAGAGGGYTPDYYESSRESNKGLYRSDDLLYGRACFVPATMLPWTHVNTGNPTTQRRTRLAGQHFLFANGYNRDWFGFDYGSLIGSFDGVSWFSIGNQRRIKASTGKLYLAVNGYFGDLSLDNSFTVAVSESNIFSSPIPTHDTESDGAECQRAHFCTYDKECFTTLGYDYSCQNVSGLMTAWPQFDANASEVVGSITKSIASIVGGTNGQTKRCMYRGRGAPCHADMGSMTGAFNNSTNPGTIGCSTNNYCAATSKLVFNHKIARFGNSPTSQNIAEVVTPLSDIVGQGARVIGRPFDYYGTKSVPTLALTSLDANGLKSLCVPGKDLTTSTTNFELHSKAPTARTETSDKMLGIGATLSGTPKNEKFLGSCPATNDAGTSVHLGLPSTLFTADTLAPYTRSQNLSTSHLTYPALTNSGLFTSIADLQVTKAGYQKNTCLRTPGATCFSDLDCAANSFIATKVSYNITTQMNAAEKKFWTEEMVCGNPDYKLINGGKNATFDVKKNKCCREFGKTLTVYTETDTSAYNWCDTVDVSKPALAGINIDLLASNRYSRNQTSYDKYTCKVEDLPGPKAFALSIKGDGADAAAKAKNRFKKIQSQFKTLDSTNSRTCCTGHWVRSFESTGNGGGHKFGKTKHQNYNIDMFRHINWFPNDTTIPSVPDAKFLCADDGINHLTSACEIRSFSDDESKKFLDFAGSLELIGIPQVAIKTSDEIFKNVDDDQLDISASQLALDHTIKNFTDAGVTVDFMTFDAADGKPRYYSAASYHNFDLKTTGLKKIFSEEEFNCCIPSNEEVPDTATADQCCTGFIITNTTQRRCCLDDYTDVTVYLNRYVSSEGRGLPDNSYDPKTGYITDPGMVMQIAAQKNLCCSGYVLSGVALNFLHKPLNNPEKLYNPGKALKDMNYRFIYRTDEVDNNAGNDYTGDYFNAGVKWNNHVYCVPKSVGGGGH